MKKLMSLLLALCMVLALASCAGGTGSTPSASAPPADDGSSQPAESAAAESSAAEPAPAEVRKIKIGYSYSNLDENLTKNWNFMQEAWKKWDEENPGYEVELIATGANMDISKQQADVESLITQGCDAIYIMVVDSDGAVPIIEAIVDAGIICVDAGYIANTEVSDLRLRTTDPHTQGMLQAEYVEKYLEENPEAVLNVGWLYGNPAATATLARHDGVAYLAEKYPDRFKVLEEQYANWLVADAMTIMEAWVQTYPEMNCIMSASDDMAIGCINVLSEQGKNPSDWLILGIDGSKSGFVNIESGNMDATVLMAVGTTSAYAIDIISSMVLGQTTSTTYGIDLTAGEINLGSLTSALVDKNNIDGMYDLAGVPRD
jgi:ABC-type sugar transport system substrate-binding protein